MSKKYGGYTGGESSVNPSKAAAPGVWQSPVEVGRQKRLDLWPSYVAGATTEVGAYVYATSTTLATGLLDEGTNFLISSGQAVSRTTYADLFSLFGEFYGAGDSFSTFNLPTVSAVSERTFKFTTTSGLTNTQQTQERGVLPNHTHTVSANPTSSPYPSGEGSPPGTPGPCYTMTSSYDGAAGGNVPKRLYMTPMLATASVSVPVGCVYAILGPGQANAIEFVPANAVVASGQAVSRTQFAKLYSRLGDIYGSGDGSTTFNVPDLRGVFISHPYPDPVSVSGTTGAPSGYYPDQFAAHAHTWTTCTTQGQGSGFTPGSVPPTTAPATGPSNIGGSENRPDNVTGIFLLVVTD